MDLTANLPRYTILYQISWISPRSGQLGYDFSIEKSNRFSVRKSYSVHFDEFYSMRSFIWSERLRFFWRKIDGLPLVPLESHHENGLLSPMLCIFWWDSSTRHTEIFHKIRLRGMFMVCRENMHCKVMTFKLSIDRGYCNYHNDVISTYSNTDRLISLLLAPRADWELPRFFLWNIQVVNPFSARGVSEFSRHLLVYLVFRNIGNFRAEFTNI